MPATAGAKWLSLPAAAGLAAARSASDTRIVRVARSTSSLLPAIDRRDADRKLDADLILGNHLDGVLAAAVLADQANATLLDDPLPRDLRVAAHGAAAVERERLEARGLGREDRAARRLRGVELPVAEDGVRAPAAREERERGDESECSLRPA